MRRFRGQGAYPPPPPWESYVRSWSRQNEVDPVDSDIHASVMYGTDVCLHIKEIIVWSLFEQHLVYLWCDRVPFTSNITQVWACSVIRSLCIEHQKDSTSTWPLSVRAQCAIWCHSKCEVPEFIPQYCLVIRQIYSCCQATLPSGK